MRARHLNARHLTERMDTGIGPARTVHRHGCAFEARERVLEQPLHRVALGLPLPAGETRAVLCERDLEVAMRVHLAQTWAVLFFGPPLFTCGIRALRRAIPPRTTDRHPADRSAPRAWRARDTGRRDSAARR